MAQAVDGITSDVEQLIERVRELERRVAALEGQPGLDPQKSAAPESIDFALQSPRPATTWRGFPGVEVAGDAVPVLGKAILGIAGAYLLRAVAESGAIPKILILMVAIAYAGFWMVWAVRTHAANRFASGAYGATSALILSPLLWESTVRFQVLAPAFTAAVLVTFVVLALALSWRRELQLVPWVTTLAAVITALALILATRLLVPFTAALLAIALATEVAACLEHRLSLRAVPSLAADFAVWLLVDVMTSSGGVPEGYRPASARAIILLCLILFAVYGGSIAVRSFALRRRITILEIGQGALTFFLAAFGIMRASQGSAATALGAVSLLLTAVCYWGALSRFTDEAYTRDRRVFAAYAAVLLLAGSYLLLPVNLRVPFLSLAAIASAVVYARTGKLSLGLHASFYLAAAVAASSLASWATSALARTVPGAPDWGVWIVVMSSALCYVFGSRGAQAAQDPPKRRLLWVLHAVLGSFAGAALAVVAIAWLAAGRVELSASRLSVIRTTVNCALALALGYLGSRGKRIELGWVAYAAVAFGTLKLLFEDLRFGNAASLVVSLLFYGLILILLPRLMRRSWGAA
ncbi:MAG: hypothetical protein WAN03_07755 [Candidatus Sulfotelmatobacter sp.]